MFNLMPLFGGVFFLPMEPNEELIESLATQYAEKYDDRFKKIAKSAYKDGILTVLKDLLMDQDMFFLGFLFGATLMVVVSDLAKRLDEIKKWNENDKSNG